MNNKKVSLRRCTGCGSMMNKKDMIRVIKTKENEIFLDLTGKAAGRGAYVCKSVDCLSLCKDKKKLNRAFSQEIPDEVYNSLIEELNNAE